MIAQPHSILLDSEALSALAVDAKQMQAWSMVAKRTDSTLHTSTLTLAEVTDGSARDIGVRPVAKTVRREPVTEQIGYRAGRLRAAASSTRHKARDLTVDAVVAATALSLPEPVVVLTSDPADLTRLLEGTSVKVVRIG